MDDKGFEERMRAETPDARNWYGKYVQEKMEVIRLQKQIASLEAATLQPAVGDGWKVVPVEPTEAMIEAWEKSKPYDGDYTDEKCATACWKDMVAAALQGEKP